MSVMSVKSETPEALALRASGVTSVMVEKPVKYDIDPTVYAHPVWLPVSEMPDVYVKYGNLAFFPFNGYLSHCWADEHGLDLDHTQNTLSIFKNCFGRIAGMQWIADLLSDIYLTRSSYGYRANYRNWVVRRFYHNQHGMAELHVYDA